MRYERRTFGTLLAVGGMALILFGCVAAIGYFAQEERDSGVVIIARLFVGYVMPGGVMLLAGHWMRSTPAKK